MAQIISVHSFRGGTGKSNTTANVAAQLVKLGKRVCIVDTDIQSPGVHVLFGIKGEAIETPLNHYLWEQCEIEATAIDVSARIGHSPNSLYLVPSSVKAHEIVEILREGYSINRLFEGYQRLVEQLSLDILLIDTHPGLNEETLFSIAVSDQLLVILRPDQQDFEGTAVTVEVARSLDIAQMQLVVNKLPSAFNTAAIKTQVEQTYDCPVAALLPHTDALMTLGSSTLFSTKYPAHMLTQQYQHIAQTLVAT